MPTSRFEAKHPIGSKARLALALLLYTGQRRGDVVRLGRQHIRNGVLFLLCHKFGCLLRAAQHGQRESVVARAATNLRRIVAIEFGTWRSGRNGGSSGLVTFA